MIYSVKDSFYFLMGKNIRCMLMVMLEFEWLHICDISVICKKHCKMPHNHNPVRTVRFTFIVPALAPCKSEFHRDLIVMHGKVLAEVIKGMKNVNGPVILETLVPFILDKGAAHIRKWSSKLRVLPDTLTRSHSPPSHTA